MILYEMLYGIHPYMKCKNLLELKNLIGQDMLSIPPINTKNKDVSIECLSLLKKLLQIDAKERMDWGEFFDHMWVKPYQYTIPKNNKKRNDYEKRLHSTSIGSLSKDDVVINNITNIKSSGDMEYTIVEDYFEKIESIQDIKKYDDDSVNNCMFEMELEVDGHASRKIVIKKIIEKSSVLDDKVNYDLIHDVTPTKSKH
jgi:serine/threonine protein kinase